MSFGRACFAILVSAAWFSAITAVTEEDQSEELDDVSLSLMQDSIKMDNAASRFGIGKLQEDPFADLEDGFDTCGDGPCDGALIFDDAKPAKLDVSNITFWVSFCLDIMIFVIVMTIAKHFFEQFQCSKKNRVACEKKELREEKAVATREEDAFGCTALHIAAQNGCAELAEVLIKRGADVNAVEAWEETPLHFAARAGMIDLCKLLMAHGAGLNARNSQHHTPLLVAAEAGKEDVCEFFLELEADVGIVEETNVPQLLLSLLMKRMIKPLQSAPDDIEDSEADDASSEF